MNQNEANKLAEHLIAVFAVNIKAQVAEESGTNTVFIIPQDLHPNDGFQIRIAIGWRSLHFDLLLGKFAAGFIEALEQATAEKKQQFKIFTEQIVSAKGVISLGVNGSNVDPLVTSSWPAGWKQVSYSLKVSPLEINTEDLSLTEQLINEWSERFLGSVLALSPLEEIETVEEVSGLPEGAQMKVVVNRYERSRINRSICSNHHGYTCKVCGLDFGKIYGKIGEGFIHVHHIKPVSQLGSNYVIDPINDLIPVCPNCHSMLHKLNPPFDIESLKKLLKDTADIPKFN